MFKKTVEFEDFDGNKQAEDFYFHISKAELIAMADKGDEMKERLQRIIEAKDGAKILNEFRELIKLAVGVRSEDGKRFIKDDVAQSTLLDSPAFDELLMELATDAEAASAFVAQLVPEKMQKDMIAQLQKNNPMVAEEDNRPAYQKESRLPTSDEIQKMSKQELVDVWAWREKFGLNRAAE